MLKLFKKKLSEAEIRELFLQAAIAGDFKILKKWIKKVHLLIFVEALQESVKHNHLGVTVYLIENGCPIFPKTKDGDSPLLLALKNGKKSIALVEYLIENGAQLDVKDQLGHTALYIALQNDYFIIAKYLLENGADPNVKNKFDGKTLLHILVEKSEHFEHFEMIQLLIKHGARLDEQDENGQSPIFITINKNHFLSYLTMKFLIEKGASLNVQDKNNATPLHCAVQTEQLLLVKYLLKKGAKVDVKDKFGRTAFFIAVINNCKMTIIAALMENGADPNVIINGKTPNPNVISIFTGKTPLHISVERGLIEMVKLLIKHGAQLDQKDKNGQSPIYIAIEKNYIEIGKFLIKQGVNLNLKDKYNNTPLHFAIKKGKFLLVKDLIENGAPLDEKDDDGQSPIYIAIKKTNIEIVKQLLEQGANFDLKDKNNETPLHCATRTKSVSIVKFLIEYGVKIDEKTAVVGMTPLHIAVQNEQYRMVKLLIQNGANVNEPNKFQYTPLFYAVSEGNETIVKYLIENGANINVTNNIGHTPFRYALLEENETIVKYLIQNGANIFQKSKFGGIESTVLHIMSRTGQFEVLECLVENGANINDTDENGQTALHISVEKGHFDMVKYLVENGADVNLTCNIMGQTALHISVDKGHFDMVKYLVENGADVNLTDIMGTTPLYFAVESSNLRILKWLLKNEEIQVDATTPALWTPLHRAAYDGKLNFVKALFENGARLDLKTGDHKTPLDLARENSHHETVNYLKKIDLTLHSAVKDGNFFLVESLISKGAQIDKQDEHGWTPLHHAVVACTYCNLQPNYLQVMSIAILLVEKGAQVDVKNSDNLTPLQLALTVYGNLEIVKILVENGGAKFDTNDILTADENGNQDVVEYLTEKENEKTLEESISNKDLCIICLSPRNGFYVLYPCYHASLCELCCTKMKGDQCPTCRETIIDFNKIYFQSA